MRRLRQRNDLKTKQKQKKSDQEEKKWYVEGQEWNNPAMSFI